MDRVFLVGIFFPFSTLNILCISLLDFKIPAEKSVDDLLLCTEECCLSILCNCPNNFFFVLGGSQYLRVCQELSVSQREGSKSADFKV